MNRDNKILKLTTFVLLITIIAVSLVAGTYAKYTTTLSGTDTAVVARFDVGSSATDASFDLFKTAITEIDGTTDDPDVLDGKIAPGTGGKFDIVLSNSSEVKVKYDITIEEVGNDAGVPVEYSIDGGEYKSAEDFETELNAMDGELAIGSSQAPTTETVNVAWRWAFEGDNDADTELGMADTLESFDVNVSVVFTQID